MTVAALLVRLYPPAVRERWGDEMVRVVAASGPRSWLDTAGGAARLWLHPADWPEAIAGQTCRVLTVWLVAITTLTVLLVRATAPPPALLAADLGRPAASAWLVPLLAGLALAAPLPPCRWRALRRLVAVGARTLSAPAVALLTLYLTANSGLVEHPTPPIDVLLVIAYWLTLAFTGLRLCTLTGRIGDIAIPPSAGRMRPALMLIGAGLALAAWHACATTLRDGPRTGTLTLLVGLVALAAAVFVTGKNLRSTSPRHGDPATR